MLMSPIAFPAGVVAGFCSAPVLYLLTYKDQWDKLWTMSASVGIVSLLVVGLLATASHLQDVRIV